ncbi:MAG: dipeptidase PepE [Bacteroidota bacterium]|nr:dipeptidase PepE [Bacteroidota bacterium]
MQKKLLLISNSTNPGESYLEWVESYIADFLHQTDIRKILFIPFAGVNLSADGVSPSYAVYTKKVQRVFDDLGYKVYPITNEEDPVKAVEDAESIMIGGGNTFFLVYMLYKWKIMDAIRQRIISGTPYIGWSAGSNVACPTLRTTNDMPIIEPESFETLNVIPFQINPHYLDTHPSDHGGETREQRILEFLAVNPLVKIVGLRERTVLRIEGEKIDLLGSRPMRYFEFGQGPREFNPGDNLDLLLH